MAADMSLTQELRPSIRYADLLNYKQWKTPRRIITDYLLLYVQEGSLQLVLDEGVQTLKPGHFLFMQPGIVHQIESLTPLRVMALHVELFPARGGEYPPMMVNVEHGQPPELEYSQPSFAMLADVTVPLLIKPSRPEWLTESMQRVIEHWSRKNAVDLLQAHVHAAEIMIEMIRDHALQGTDELRSSTDLSWVPAYLQYRMAEPLSVEEMARKAFMSRSYFSRLFTRQFGAAPHQYLLRLRLDSATDLLKGSDLPLQDIADQCGFSSVHHFSKMYKLRYGCPPSLVRNLDKKTF